MRWVSDRRSGYFLRCLSVAMLAGWMAVIFSFSARPAVESQEQSYFIGRMVADVVQRISGFAWSGEQRQLFVEGIDFYIRKGAHASEYAVLGMLILWVMDNFGRLPRGAWRWGWLAGTLYAVSDEVHQCFVPGRACQLRDMIIDGLGVFAGIGLYLGCRRLWRFLRKSPVSV